MGFFMLTSPLKYGIGGNLVFLFVYLKLYAAVP